MLLLLGHLSISFAAQVIGEFSFSNFLEGTWTVQRTLGSVHGLDNNNNVQADEVMHWVVAHESDDEGSLGLVGTDVESDPITMDYLRTRSINIAFDDDKGNTGVFSIASSEDDATDDAEEEDEFDAMMKPWFAFDFTRSLENGEEGRDDGTLPSSSHISHGKCGAPFTSGFCQLTVYNDNTFVITVFPQGDSRDMTVFAGNRIVPPKGFFTQYLPQLGLGCLLLVNIYIQSKSRAAQNKMNIKNPEEATTVTDKKDKKDK